MSLYEEVEELEKQLEEEENKDEENNEEDVNEEEGKDEGGSDADEGEDEQDADKDSDEEDDKKDEGDQDNEDDVDLDDDKKRKQAFAKLRRENAALKRKQQEKLEPQEQPKQETKEEVKEPEKYTEDGSITREWFEWENQRLREEISGVSEYVQKTQAHQEQEALVRGAVQELREYEQNFKHEVDDFDGVAEAYQAHMTQSIKSLNPSATDEQVKNILASHMLKTAGQFVSEGKDPAEEMYHMAKEIVGDVSKGEEKKEKRDDMKNTKTAAKNRRRSASPLKKGRGESGSRYTADQLSNMSPADLQRLSPAELQELENEAQTV